MKIKTAPSEYLSNTLVVYVQSEQNTQDLFSIWPESSEGFSSITENTRAALSRWSKLPGERWAHWHPKTPQAS